MGRDILEGRESRLGVVCSASRPAPNQAILLAPDGTVLAEHGWFNGDGLDMEAEIARVLEPAG